jgi:oxygen-dependent protoporphyrinogen oxidase
MHTEERDGYRCEWGPNGWLDSAPATMRLVGALGLGEEMVPSSDAARVRWIVRDGRLRRLPVKPSQLLGSNVLSAKGRVRLGLEFLQSPRRDAADESVYDFARRRLGSEAAEVLVDAMVTGIYAGDPHRLSLEACFPRLRSLERDHGSLLRAAIVLQRERARTRRAAPEGAAPASHGGPFGPAGVLTSFEDGMESLVRSLAGALGEQLVCNARVTHLARVSGGWQLDFEHGAPLAAQHVVLACPAWIAAPLLRGLDAELSEWIGAIPSAPVAIVCLGWAESDLAAVPRGFGFLVPGQEKSAVLGTLFDSWIFPHRAPAGRALWRVLLGGARAPAILDLDDAALADRALHTIQKWLRLGATPEMVHVVRHPRAIPQYPVGHPRTIARIAERLDRHPGLHLSGNSYRGVALNACIHEAETLAARLAGAPLPAAPAVS